MHIFFPKKGKPRACKKLFNIGHNSVYTLFHHRCVFRNVLKLTFCSSCGKPLQESNVFCPSCGVRKESLTLPKDISKQNKFWNVWLKIQIVLGIIVLIGGIIFSNYYNVVMGVLLFAVGFISLKTISKTIQQLMGIISFIIFVVSLMTLTDSW